MYRHRQHLIHLFVWPATNRPNLAMHSHTRQGYQLMVWSDAAMQYWAISDLNAEALKSFSTLIQEQAKAVPMAQTIHRLPVTGDLR